MSFRKRNKGRKKDLKKQTEKSQKNKDQKGVFLKYYTLPEGIEEYRPKENEKGHIIDIVPWNCGKHHHEEKKGTKVYFQEVYVHQNIGGKKEPIICPYHTSGDDCPICAYINANHLPKKQWGQIVAKRRVIYLVWVHTDADQEKKGVQVWEVSHFLSEKKFLESAKNPRTGGSIVYSDEDEGQSLYFEIEGKGMNQEWSAHKCLPREGDPALPDKILDKSFALDSILHEVPTFDYIEEAFTGQRTAIEKIIENGEEEEPEPEKGSTGDDVPYPDEKESLSKKDKKKKKSKKKDKKKKKK